MPRTGPCLVCAMMSSRDSEEASALPMPHRAASEKMFWSFMMSCSWCHCFVVEGRTCGVNGLLFISTEDQKTRTQTEAQTSS